MVQGSEMLEAHQNLTADAGGKFLEPPSRIAQSTMHVPLPLAMVTAWIAPAWTARRTGHVRLIHAWIVHFATAVASLFLILLCVAAGSPSNDLGRELLSLFGIYAEALSEYPTETILATVGIFVGVEVVHVAVAGLFMPWGAKDEPLRASFKNSLRQCWLRTSHFLPAILVVGSAAVLIERGEQSWRQSHPVPPPVINWPASPRPPNLPAGDPGYAKALADYQAALTEHQRRMEPLWEIQTIYLAGRPWYYKEPELIIIPAVAAMIAWILWALLRAIGAERTVPPIVRPPMCLECGYNLHTIPMESRCPECGLAVLDSLGPDAHPGTDWQQRSALGSSIASWWECVVLAIWNPRQLGRELRVADSGTDHRHFLAVNLLVIFFIGAIGVFCGVATADGIAWQLNHPAPAIVFPLVYGVACVLGTTAVVNKGALLVGIVHSLRQKRNLLPASIQVACYLSGYLALWAMLGALLAVNVLILGQAQVFDRLEKMIGAHRDVLAFLSFVLPNGGLALGYLVLLHRATNAAAHANG
ncbi:MAG: hypothetical protein AABZ12_00440 [Planctomycetota bacterium]